MPAQFVSIRSVSPDGFSTLSRTSKALPCQSKMLRRYGSTDSVNATGWSGRRPGRRTPAARVTRAVGDDQAAGFQEARAGVGQDSCRTFGAGERADDLGDADTNSEGEAESGRLAEQERDPARGLKGQQVGGRLVERVLDDLDGHSVPGSGLHAFARPEQVLSRQYPGSGGPVPGAPEPRNRRLRSSSVVMLVLRKGS